MEPQEKHPIISAKCPHCGQPVKFCLPVNPGKVKFTCKNPQCGKIFGVNVPEELIKNLCGNNPTKPVETEPIFSGGNGETLAHSNICSIITKKRGLFNTSKIFPLQKGENVIGRKDPYEPSDIELDDPTISRRSIIINVEEKGNGYKYRFKVIKCTNPVCVDGEQKDVNIEYYIEPGAKILLGRTTLILK